MLFNLEALIFISQDYALNSRHSSYSGLCRERETAKALRAGRVPMSPWQTRESESHSRHLSCWGLCRERKIAKAGRGTHMAPIDTRESESRSRHLSYWGLCTERKTALTTRAWMGTHGLVSLSPIQDNPGTRGSECNSIQLELVGVPGDSHWVSFQIIDFV